MSPVCSVNNYSDIPIPEPRPPTAAKCLTVADGHMFSGHRRDETTRASAVPTTVDPGRTRWGITGTCLPVESDP